MIRVRLKIEDGEIYDTADKYGMVYVKADKRFAAPIKDFAKTHGVELSFLVGGHKHHQNSSNIGIQSDVISVPSVIGVDDYSLSLHKTSE